MKIRLLSIAAAAALALGALGAGPNTAAAAVSPMGAAAQSIAAEAGTQATEVRDRKRRYGRKHYNKRNWKRGRSWHHQRQYRPRYRSYNRCWRTYRIHTPWGYVAKRVWVCR